MYRQLPLDFSPKFIGPRNCVPVVFIAESLAQGQQFSRQFQERVLPFQVSP